MHDLFLKIELSISEGANGSSQIANYDFYKKWSICLASKVLPAKLTLVLFLKSFWIFVSENGDYELSYFNKASRRWLLIYFIILV